MKRRKNQAGEELEQEATGPARHEPVMLTECLDYLQARAGGVYVDGTLGLAGHAVALMERAGIDGLVIGLDRDPEALRRAGERLEARCIELGWEARPYHLIHTDFRDLGAALAKPDDSTASSPHSAIGGFLFDLGVSSMQLDLAERGFSFRSGGPLDMRMNPSEGEPASDLVNELSEVELARVLWEYGDERYSRRIARRVAERREETPFETTDQLADLIWHAYPADERRGRIHPATRSFQALRIKVNDELAALEPALFAAADQVAPGGRIVVMAYHSLEDRIVKKAFEFLSGRCRCPVEIPFCHCGAKERGKTLTRKPVQPGDDEIARNPRARSARLRVWERLPEA